MNCRRDAPVVRADSSAAAPSASTAEAYQPVGAGRGDSEGTRRQAFQYEIGEAWPGTVDEWVVLSPLSLQVSSAESANAAGSEDTLAASQKRSGLEHVCAAHGIVPGRFFRDMSLPLFFPLHANQGCPLGPLPLHCDIGSSLVSKEV